MSKITFIPSGGLANRMRAMASAVNQSQLSGAEINMIWFSDWGLKARFCDTFEPFSIEKIRLREATVIDKITVDRARKSNFFIPSIYQKVVYSKRILEQQVTPLKKQNFDFVEWAREGNNYMSCYQVYGDFADYEGLIHKLFTPVKVIQDKIAVYTTQFSQHTIGMHIRRTDNAESIKCSPTEKFIEKADAEIAKDDRTKIFLATDDEETKKLFRQKYGDRVITPDVPASRDSLEGIRDGIVDMWTLAATDIIYGSKGSSFSPMASTIGRNALVIIE